MIPKIKFPILSFLKILLLCYIITALLLSCAAFLLLKLKLADVPLSFLSYAIYLLVCFLGGFLAGKNVSQKRFLWGLMQGVLYFAVLLALSFAIQKQMSQNWGHLFTCLGLCALGGMAGGMLS